MAGTPGRWVVPLQRRPDHWPGSSQPSSELEFLVERLTRLVLNAYALADRTAELSGQDSPEQAERLRRLWVTVDNGRRAIIAVAAMP